MSLFHSPFFISIPNCTYIIFSKVHSAPIWLLFRYLVVSHVWLFANPWTAACQGSPSCPSLSPLVCSDSHPLSQGFCLTISSSASLFSFYLQSFPESGTFPMSQLFASNGQSIRASAKVLPMNIQGWFPLGWTGWISLTSKGFSIVFFNTTVQKHQFFGTQPSSQSNSHIHTTWLLDKP